MRFLPCCLLVDLDGTLLDLAPTPDAVVVPPGLVTDLGRLRARLSGALALVSGRPIAQLDRLLAPLVLAAAGVHGAELRRAPDAPVERCPPPGALARVEKLLGSLDLPPGTLVERKGAAIAIHWRAAAGRPEALVAALERLVAASGGSLGLLAGKAVLEVRDARLHKGAAVQALLARPPFAGRRPIFVGDDRTDEDAFRAVEAQGGVALPVGPAPPAGRPAVFDGPAAVRAWLARAAAGGSLDPTRQAELPA